MPSLPSAAPSPPTRCGFHFAVAENFKIKPLIALLVEKGVVILKTGGVVTELPEKGRAAELANFAKACALD